MDLGIQFTKGEEQAMQAEARKELEEEGQLEKLAAETAAAVDAKVEVEAQVAALEDAGLEVGAKSISEDGIIDDEGYVSGEEDDGAKAVAVTGGGDLIAGSSMLDPVDSLDFLDAVAVTDGSITPGSSDQGFNDSYPPTPLDSPLGLTEELDEGFVEGVSAAETNITPEGSINEIQNTFESDGSLDVSLPFDDGLSADERDEKKRKFNRKLVKLKLKALDERDAQERREARGGAGSAEGEDHLPDDPEVDAASMDDKTPPNSSALTPPASTASTITAEADAVSTSDAPPVSSVPSPEVSKTSTDNAGPFHPQETDRRVLRNSAAKRVIAALFPGDQFSTSEIAARNADQLLNAAASAVKLGRFPVKDAKKAQELADDCVDPWTVDERFILGLGNACADVAASLDSKASGSIKERIEKQMEANGTSVAGEQPGQSI